MRIDLGTSLVPLGRAVQWGPESDSSELGRGGGFKIKVILGFCLCGKVGVSQANLGRGHLRGQRHGGGKNGPCGELKRLHMTNWGGLDVWGQEGRG